MMTQPPLGSKIIMCGSGMSKFFREKTAIVYFFYNSVSNN